MTLKLVVIGGGSSYTPEIIEGVLKRHHQLSFTEIVLVDIEEGKEKVKIIADLAKRMIQQEKKEIKLSWTLDLEYALREAEFVTTQIRVGGLDARERDERIPLSHGFIGQETNGAGGILKAFRTFPVMLQIAEAVHRICPEAWMINFTNPAGIITEALLKYSTHKKVIGVCNIPYHMQQSAAEILEVNADQVLVEFIGLNHFVFGRRVEVNGIDYTEELTERLDHNHAKYSPANIIHLGSSKAFMQNMKLIPNPYHQYYYQTKDMLATQQRAYKNGETRAKAVKQLEKQLFAIYQDSALTKKPEQLEERGGAFYSEVACRLMDSLYNNRKDIQTVNTLNNGAIKELPDDAVIEVNCFITKDGPEPITIVSLPMAVKGDILQMKAFEELVIEAGISGDYHQAYQAFLANPLIKDEKRAKALLDEMLAANHKELPQFMIGG
ncbi:6-phospho-beta-glucosidase [Gracilibacillus caseinilyticus]|uniref:6-phospho-beta-glucosidase n=1 Tax=Gracilibacillus caseinilyticus TaxID=2932256 RepID=A0ABY4EQH5_9BACI|nr:6-phospho-beta-glucosidase [Gracilibacillus caseinilyticus]UOQ46704.1 6-phospho-beta-glucosidase [Gracilibacillus caseinilyticus]